MNILWSEKAEEDFEANVLYLMENWNVEVVQDFTSEVQRILNIISLNPKTFQYNLLVKCHVVPVTKHVSLFYEIKKKNIVLLRYWNNYQNPRKFSLKTKK
jgi:plasmid stabilization system protein ParE